MYATFQCVVTVIDETTKAQMSRQLYDRRRDEVGGSMANTTLDDTDDEDLIGYDAISPGLPPASSDRRKWWLDNGKIQSLLAQCRISKITHKLDNRPPSPIKC